jgi:hypothetical protein
MAERPGPTELPGRLGDDELWRCVDETLARVILPALADDADWARAAAVQLIGLVRYAGRRGADPTAERTRELARVLRQLAANELVTWDGQVTERSVNDAVGSALADAVGRTDADADEVRRVLRPITVRQLDDELAVTAPLVAAFRGKLDA